MRIDVVTLFPEMLTSFAALGMVGRAVAQGALSLRLRSPRDFGVGPHRKVDDAPYGGGAGMVMRADVLVACLESLDADAPTGADGAPVRAKRVLLSPRGDRLDQTLAVVLAREPAIALVCGRFEGIDERVSAHVHAELSLGDFVLSGGEVAAMAVIECLARLLPGVLGNPASLVEESHDPVAAGWLEYPQYTRPPTFRGAAVPAVLLSGDHARVAAWRREQARQHGEHRSLAVSPTATPQGATGSAKT
jgi:tRNA (guanine37-N1)-methyltransferase